MDVVLQRHCAKYIYVVPEGLRELLSDISREVLRSQPENMYTFIADYLDALMITRENARVAARLVQTITETSENIIEFLNRTNMTREKADQVATVIQRAFRKHLEEQAKYKEIVDESVIVREIIEEAGITKDQADMAACIIQNAFRRFQERKEYERKMGLGMLDWRAAARSAILLYRRTGVTPEEANRAATLIQASYKGYYTRKLKKLLLERTLIEDFDLSVADDDYSKGGDKKVRIDYSTVIPHVDFDEPSDEDSTVIVVKDILDIILRQVIPGSRDQLRKFDETEVDAFKRFRMGEYGEDKEGDLAKERESLEQFILSLLMEQIPSDAPPEQIPQDAPEGVQQFTDDEGQQPIDEQVERMPEVTEPATTEDKPEEMQETEQAIPISESEGPEVSPSPELTEETGASEVMDTARTTEDSEFTGSTMTDNETTE